MFESFADTAINSGLPGTDKSYHLKGFIKVLKETYFTDEGRQESREAVILIPDDGGERAQCFFTWLPSVEGERQELPAFIGSPWNRPARVALMIADRFYQEDHYFYVMSVSACESLKKHDGRRVDITILPEHEDEAVDLADAHV